MIIPTDLELQLALAIGLALRTVAALDPRAPPPVVHLLLRQALAAAAAWLVASAMGCWTPWWPILPAAFAGTLLCRVMPRGWSRLMADMVTVGAFGLLAVPTAGLPLLVGTLLFFAGWGVLSDHWLGRRVPARLRLALPLAAAVAIILAAGFALRAALPQLAPGLQPVLALGIMSRNAGARLELPSGATGWLALGSPGKAALLLHGNHPLASRQPAAGPLRRALLAAGYSVVSVDHIGYGLSPGPDIDAPVTAWDPLPGVMEAKAAARAILKPDELVVVGHSMGTRDALRLIAADGESRSAVLFGAAFSGDDAHSEYWYERFHARRGLTERLPHSRWVEIDFAYYDPASVVGRLPRDHAPVIFVRFEFEHDDLVAGRDAMYTRLPGRKLLKDFPGTTHYFNALTFRSLVIADVHAGRRLAHELAHWLDEAGRPSAAPPGD